MATGLNYFGIDPNADNYAGRTFDALSKQQWNTYLSQFVPLENETIEYAMDEATVGNAVTDARQNVAQSFAQQQGIQDRALRSQGLVLNADEQQAADRSSAIARTTAEVNAGNLAASRTRDRQSSILGNPAPSAQGT